jgi:hypothetical protein
MCNQQWKPKSTIFGHAGKSQNMEHEPFLQVEDETNISYHKPLMVKFPDKCEWQKRNKPEPDIEGS